MDFPPFPEAAIAAARDAARAHLRIAGASEDALLGTLAATALALAERFTGTALIARDFAETLEPGPQWRALTAAPVQAIDDVTDPAGGALPSPTYAIDIDADGTGRVRAATRIRIGYRAGTAEGWDDLPPPLATGVLLLVAHLFEHRERDAAPPTAVSALWRPWRRVRLAAA